MSEGDCGLMCPCDPAFGPRHRFAGIEFLLREALACAQNMCDTPGKPHNVMLVPRRKCGTQMKVTKTLQF